ncbi:DNase I-like protein, partial [Hymenopellis radicata]
MNGGAVVDGDGAANKWMHVNQMMRDDKIGVLVVGEAHLNDERKDKLDTLFDRRLDIHFSENVGNDNAVNSKGVAIVLNKNYVKTDNVKSWNIIPGQALLIQTEWHGDKSLTVLGVYAANETKKANKRVWDKIRKFYEKNPDAPRPDFMAGDCNMVEKPIDRLPPRDDALKVTNAFDKLKIYLQLYDGWRETYPDQINYTYDGKPKPNSQSRIDRIYVTAEILENSRDWKIADPGLVDTDHMLVLAQISCEEAPEVGKGRWTIPEVVLKDDEFLNHVETEGRATLAKMNAIQINAGQEGTVQSLFKTMKDSIIEKAKARQKKLIPAALQKINALDKEREEVLN